MNIFFFALFEKHSSSVSVAQASKTTCWCLLYFNKTQPFSKGTPCSHCVCVMWSECSEQRRTCIIWTLHSALTHLIVKSWQLYNKTEGEMVCSHFREGPMAWKSSSLSHNLWCLHTHTHTQSPFISASQATSAPCQVSEKQYLLVQIIRAAWLWPKIKIIFVQQINIINIITPEPHGTPLVTSGC